MKIAMVCPFFLPVVGGMEKHVYNLSKELINRGHQVTVFTSMKDHDGKDICPDREIIEGIEVRRFRQWFRIGKFARFWPHFAVQLKGFDIIHTHNLRHTHSEMSLIGKVEGTPIVITPHSPLHEGTRGIMLDTGIKIYDILQRYFPLPYYDEFIALHEEEREWLMGKGVEKNKITIIPNGIEKAFLAPIRNGKRKKFILYVGRINKAKGLDLLLRAVAFMGEKFNCRLILVGPDGGFANELKMLARNLGIGKRVMFAGEVPQKKLIEYLDEAAVFVLPSKYEPFGISLVEAMARGDACVAINRGGPKYILKNGTDGLLVNYEEGELAHALQTLMNNEKLRRKLGRNARKTAEKYSWRRIADKVEKEYLKLVKTR